MTHTIQTYKVVDRHGNTVRLNNRSRTFLNLLEEHVALQFAYSLTTYPDSLLGPYNVVAETPIVVEGL
jgi:hypothetical protein